MNTNNWYLKYNSEVNKVNNFKEVCHNSNDIINKPLELFSLLKNRYLDRLSTIKVQQEMINKLNTLLSLKDKDLIKSKQKIDLNNDKIDTKSRIIKYDTDDNNLDNIISKYLKISLFILIIILIAKLFYKSY